VLGYPDQALQRSQEALTLARDLAHPFSMAYALGYASRVHELRGERHAAEAQIEAQMVLAHEQGFELFLTRGVLWQGRAMIEQGREAEGVAQMRQGLAAFRALGAELGRPAILAWLAGAYKYAGQVEEGLKVLAEALVQTDSTGERFYEAELYRLKGELTLQQSSIHGLEISVQNEAEVCFLKAIAIARRQSAKSWELRATVSLARLWQQEGKKDEAHKLLSEVYNWFTEGFDTKDLQEAKDLLEELP
jgi:predicted ATPase